MKQFCKEHGLTEYSFYAWRKRLQESGPVRFALVKKSARRQERTAEPALERHGYLLEPHSVCPKRGTCDLQGSREFQEDRVSLGLQPFGMTSAALSPVFGSRIKAAAVGPANWWTGRQCDQWQRWPDPPLRRSRPSLLPAQRHEEFTYP